MSSTTTQITRKLGKKYLSYLDPKAPKQLRLPGL